MNGDDILVTTGTVPLRAGLQVMANRDGVVATKAALCRLLQGDGTMWRAAECVERLMAAGYLSTELVRENEGRTQRFEIRMTEAGWAACRRLGVEKW